MALLIWISTNSEHEWVFFCSGNKFFTGIRGFFQSKSLAEWCCDSSCWPPAMGQCAAAGACCPVSSRARSGWEHLVCITGGLGSSSHWVLAWTDSFSGMLPGHMLPIYLTGKKSDLWWHKTTYLTLTMLC